MTRPLHANRAAADAAADKLRVFAQPQRLMILSFLLGGTRTVSEIGDGTGIAQPALSQQLGELRRAGLVRTRREAKQVWYELADEGAAACVRTMETMFGGGGDAPLPPARGSAPADDAVASGVAGFAQVRS